MIYLVIINVLGFLIMGLDKAKAKKQKYRISENTLLFVALIGGSLGSYLGMYCFHHKTKHMKFIVFIFIQNSRQEFCICYNTNVLSECFDPHC